MLNDYQATTTRGEEFATAAADEQHIEDVSKQISRMLEGLEISRVEVSVTGGEFAYGFG
jgi:hypothetical protein